MENLKHGSVKEAHIMFNTSRSTIDRIWRQARLCVANGDTVNVSTNLAGRVERKRIQVDINQFKEIPLCRRTNIRSLSFAINMAKSTAF